MKLLYTLFAFCSACSLAAQTPMTLRDCIERAQQRNIKVRQAEINQKQQALQLDDARKAFLPEVNGSAGENLSFGRGLTANNTYETRNTNSTSLSVSASMPLYTGGRLTHRRKQAALNLQAAGADARRLAEELQLQVAQAYYQVLFRMDLIAQAQTNLRNTLAQEERIGTQIRAGRLPEVDLAQAQARTAQDRLALVQAENDKMLALLELSQLLEYTSPDSLKVTPPTVHTLPAVPGNPEEVYALSLTERPALQAAQLRSQAADEQIEIARAGMRPTLHLNAGLGTSYYNTSGVANAAFGRQLRDNLSQNIGLSLAVPIFDRHSTRNSVASAQLAAANARLDEEELRKSLYKEIQNAYYAALTARHKWQAAQVADSAAVTAANLAQKKYEAGKGSFTDYDEARNKQTNAAVDRITAFYEARYRQDVMDFYAGKPLQ
jgi:putative outer membrane transport/efflux protein